MMLSFVHSIQSEWFKKRHSLGAYVVLIGSFLVPCILTADALTHRGELTARYADEFFWQHIWKASWQPMAAFLMPVGVILIVSLITQLEAKNNTWKQLHALPLPFVTIFFSKLTVILLMIMQCFVLFNVGIYLYAIIPWLIFPEVKYPAGTIPFLVFLNGDMMFFIVCLPIIALQYVISLHFKNFMVGIGFGFGLWISTLIAISWKYAFVIPYSYSMMYFLKSAGRYKETYSLTSLSLGYSAIFIFAGLAFYLFKSDRS